MKYTILFILSLIHISTHAQHPLKLPNGKKAVIILTYDDALQSQLSVAIPQLSKYGFRGTFFLDGRIQESDMEKWKDVSKSGHELANHTLYHPCSRHAFKNNERLYSENYDLPSILAEIRMMNKLLFLIDGKTERSYAYPCTEISVGGKQYADTLGMLNLVKYARVGGNEDAMITNLSQLDNMQIPSFAVSENQDASALIDYAENVRKNNGVGVLMFHGVGGDYISVTAEAHDQFLQYLKDHADEVWVAPLQEVFNFLSGN